jgi:formylglycine-generating enzyme required for sulfatase activity
MRRFVVWFVVVLATAGTACREGSKQRPEDGKTIGASTSTKTAQPPARGQATAPAEPGKATHDQPMEPAEPEVGPLVSDASGKTKTAQPLAQSQAAKAIEQGAAQPVDAGGKTKAPLKQIAVDLGGGVKMELILVPAGSFMMGDLKGDSVEKPVHKVTITKPFFLAKYEVTQEQWEAVMGKPPSHSKGPQNPVESLSWDACQTFLTKLNEKCGGTGSFSLPTEAQWEYACRAGTTTRYSFGDDTKLLGDHAWHFGNCKETHPVGQKKPNAWGLYDMHGNVWEWCADWFGGDYYGKSPADDPIGPASGTSRVVRGGSWKRDSSDLFRCADRGRVEPGDRNDRVGFRVARTVTP